MGRITVFTAYGDLNSKQVLKELESRSLPYQEIDLVIFPSKLSHLEALVGTASVPHVFFNERYVGGVEGCLQELKRWDSCCKRYYKNPLERYQAEIHSEPEPTNHLLALPNVEPISLPAALKRKAKVPVQMPATPDNGLPPEMYVRDVLVHLRKLIPHTNCIYNDIEYKKSFTGKMFVDSICRDLYVSTKQAMEFGQDLSDKGLIRHVDPQSNEDDITSFQANDQHVYRLQCHANPHVLNSFLTWPDVDVIASSSSEQALPLNLDVLELVENLNRLLSVMELSSIDPDDGLLNAQHAVQLEKFACLEEAVCELQTLPVSSLPTMSSEEEKTAFGLNLYYVMIRYAYLKLGVPRCERDRIHFCQNTKFVLAGTTYTLQDWIHTLLGLCSSKTNPSLTLKKRDKRVLMALFCGPHAGGSKWSLPFTNFSPDNIEEQLNMAAKVFCLEDGHVRVNRCEVNRLELLAPVFKTYGRHVFRRVRNGSMSDSSGATIIDPCDSGRAVAKALLAYLVGKKRSDVSTMLVMCHDAAPGDKDSIQITYMEPRFGQHTVAGPWYEPLQDINNSRQRTEKNKHQFDHNEDEQQDLSFSSHDCSDTSSSSFTRPRDTHLGEDESYNEGQHRSSFKSGPSFASLPRALIYKTV